MTAPDVAGLIGASLFLIAYGAGALGKLDATSVPALAANLFGAVLILVSLCQDFNLASFLLESAWGAIALAGLVRAGVLRAQLRRRR